MELSIQDIDEYFASPFTAEIWKELWAESKRIEGKNSLDLTCDGRLKLIEVAYRQVNRDLEAFEKWDLYSECHGCDHFLANLQEVERIRIGMFHGRWVEGYVVAHPTEPFVLAIYFCVRKVPRVYISDLNEVDEYFASPSTTDDIKALWARFKHFKALERPLDFKRVHISGNPISAVHIRGIWQGRIEGVLMETSDCYGDEEFLKRLEKVEMIRFGRVNGERIHSIIAAHADEPFIVGFFFWVIKSS